MSYDTSTKIGTLTMKVLNQKGEIVELIAEDVPVDIEFDYTPGDPGVHTYSNGDPGYAPTGATIEILNVCAAENVRLWDGEDKNSISVNLVPGQDITALLTTEQIATLEETIDEPTRDEPDYPLHDDAFSLGLL